MGCCADPFEIVTCPEGEVPALTSDCFSGACWVSNDPLKCFVFGVLIALIVSKVIR